MTLDESALANDYRDRVVYFVLRRVRDRSVAEEIAQATLLILIEAIRENRIRKEETVGSFIFGVATNLIREHRREATRRDGIEALEAAERQVVWGDDPEAALLLSEQQRLVGRALAMLSPEDRELLILLNQSGRSAQAVASEIGVSWPALRKRKSRALARLKEVLKESQKGGP